MISLAELERRCHKPDHRRVGNWMARRVARPLALRVTWLIAPAGLSAHAVTLFAWLIALASAVAFGWGTPASWLLGAGLLQLWYLLDHVDGQLARFHDTQSLDGAQLDYLMHHFVNLIVPFGLGWGLASGTQRGWILAGLWLGVGLLFIGLRHDTRYKTFIQRLKRLEGRLLVCGGGGGRPEPTPPVPRRPLRLLFWLLRKMCEIHVVMNTLLILAVGQWLWGDAQLIGGQIYLATLAPVATLLALVTLARGIRRGESQREFAAWYRPCEGQTLVFDAGWWRVVEIEEETLGEPRHDLAAKQTRGASG